jgi:hypothetical protein
MTVNAQLNFGEYRGGGCLEISAPASSYAFAFSHDASKAGASAPAGADCTARRRLTKSEEEETIIINRSGRSTYPEEKSVQTSGATPDVAAAERKTRLYQR